MSEVLFHVAPLLVLGCTHFTRGRIVLCTVGIAAVEGKVLVQI